MSGCIYKVTNTINDKIYIGQTVNFFKRKNEHFKKCFNQCIKSIFYKNIREYGWDNFKWEILYENVPENQLNNMEIWTIANYNSYENGYNQTNGGMGTRGFKYSEQRKLESSEIAKKNGFGLWMKGRNLSEEHKKHISIGGKGKKRTPETCEKLRIVNTGRNVSEDCRKKMSLSHKGKKLSEEQKLKISLSSKSKTLAEHFKQTTIEYWNVILNIRKLYNISTKEARKIFSRGAV